MAERQKLSLTELPCPGLKINKDRIIIEVNILAENSGIKVGTYCWDSFGKRASIPQKDREFFERHNRPPVAGTMCYFCRADEALAIQAHIVENIFIGGDAWETHWIPVDENHYIHYGIKVSEGK